MFDDAFVTSHINVITVDNVTIMPAWITYTQYTKAKKKILRRLLTLALAHAVSSPKRHFILSSTRQLLKFGPIHILTGDQ